MTHLAALLALLAGLAATTNGAQQATAVALGSSAWSTCARISDGTVKCWGANAYGALGIESTVVYGGSENPLLDAKLGTGQYASMVAAGQSFTCAILTNGVKCWGDNYYGQLGQGNRNDSYGMLPGQMGDALPFIDFGSSGHAVTIIAASVEFSCAVFDNGGVKCWGENNGQLGQGTDTIYGAYPNTMGDVLPFVLLGTEQSASAIALGESHVCVILTGGLKCWGENDYGQLGLGNTDDHGQFAGEMGDNLPFVNLSTTGQTVTGIAAGELHSCALLSGGGVKCWGYNAYGQLGLGLAIDKFGNTTAQTGDGLPFVDLGTAQTATQIAAGLNGNGQLGIGNTDTMGVTPEQMGNALPFVNLGTDQTAIQIAAAYSHTCALITGGIKCWGSNGAGELGTGNYLSYGSGGYGAMGDSLPFVGLFTTWSPSASPTSAAPSKSPVSKAPSKSPVSKSPSASPVTKAPSSAPTTSAPTPPTTLMPSRAPSKSPSASPSSKSPSASPISKSPSASPVKSRSDGTSLKAEMAVVALWLAGVLAMVQ